MTTGYASLEDALPFWHPEEDGTMVYRDGSLGCGFRLSGADVGCADNGSINDFSAKLENLIGSTGEGTRIEFFYKLSSPAEAPIREHEGVSEDAPAVYAPLRDSRSRFLRGRAASGGIFLPETYCFLRGRPHAFSKRRFWQPPKSFERMTKGHFGDHKRKFARRREKFASSLEHAGLVPEALTTQEWSDLLFGYFNPERAEKLPPPPAGDDGSFASRLLLTDLSVHRDHLRIGRYFVATATLKSLPEGETRASMCRGFLSSLPFPFVLGQNIETGNQNSEVDRLKFQRRLANSMAAGAKNVSDLESESALRHTEGLLSELLEGSEKVVSMDTNVTVWADSLEELENRCDEVLRAFQAMGRSEGIFETLPLVDAFVACAPGVCGGFRMKRVKSSNCAHLMPVYAGWRGNERPVCLFTNQDGEPVKIDPFDPGLPNWNALVFAASGSGKSFAVLQIAMQLYGSGPTPRIVWIDNGASSARFLETMGGQFIDLGIDSDIRLNPFDLPEGQSVPSPGKVKLVLAVLEQILGEDGDKGLPKRHGALLEEAIHRVYEETGGTPTLSDFKNLLEGHGSKEMRDYAVMLYPWTGGRAYGRMLDGKTNIDPEKDLVAIETGGLDGHPDLQNVMMLVFTGFIKAKAAADAGRPTLLVIDEAWKLLETPSGRDFTVEAYRTFRKYGSGIWCVSQNYKDFLADGAVADALFPNTASTFVLKQTKIDWADFQKRLQLNEAETEAAKSLESVKGEYADVLLMQNEHRAVLRIEADPLAYWIATTDPKDKAIIAEAKRKNPDLTKLEVLEKIY